MSRLLIALLALACAAAIWGAFRLDAPVRAAVVAAQGKSWKKTSEGRFMAAVRVYGDWPPLMLGCLVALAIARGLNSRRWARVIAAAMIASTLAGIVANASRLTTGRTRPKEKIEQGFYGPWHEGKLLIGQSGFNSFPSGHTATAFGLAAVVLYACPLAGVAAVAGAALVAWSSIVMGAHHPSDVTVSILLSFVVGWFVWRWARGPGGETLERWLRFPREG
jgi:membrane-associated phospholipid phosphatase